MSDDAAPPESLPPLRLERLELPRVELGSAVLGRALVLAVEGRAGVEPDGRRAAAAFQLRRTDEPTAELALDAALDLSARALALRLEGEERGGLLAAAARLERAGAARLRAEEDFHRVPVPFVDGPKVAFPMTGDHRNGEVRPPSHPLGARGRG